MEEKTLQQLQEIAARIGKATFSSAPETSRLAAGAMYLIEEYRGLRHFCEDQLIKRVSE